MIESNYSRVIVDRMCPTLTPSGALLVLCVRSDFALFPAKIFSIHIPGELDKLHVKPTCRDMWSQIYSIQNYFCLFVELFFTDRF